MRLPGSPALLFAAFTFAAPFARGQAPLGSDKLSPAAVAESLQVLDSLKQRITANPNDAAAWYRTGMVAWVLSERDRNKPKIPGLDWTLLGRQADTSLRMAMLLDPENAQAHLMVGRYLLASGVSITRFASGGMFDAAVEAARKNSDPLVHSEAALEAGRTHWRRYDALANRPFESTPGIEVRALAENLSTANAKSHAFSEPVPANGRIGYTREATRKARQTLDANWQSPAGFIGAIDYIRAELLFHESFDAAPSNTRAYRQYAMLLADRNRWTEIDEMARVRVHEAPWDAWAWMTLGMASYRRGNTRYAAVAFDSALTMLAPAERTRLDHLERILAPADSLKYAVLGEANRAALERLYWLSSDPLWSQEASVPRLEFLSRIAYAELRWTVEEMHVRGADTDRGNVYIRFGPPDRIATSSSEIIWEYDFEALYFQFDTAPTFATAWFSPKEADVAADIFTAMPVSWRNLPRMLIDSMPTQIARFRAPADSVDVVIAVLAPVAHIASGAEVSGSVRTDLWILAGGTVSVARDSVRPAPVAVHVYHHRLANGTYLYRTEASADGSLVGARASAAIVAGTDTASGFAMSGFGISDVLVSSRPAPENRRAGRWNDLAATPVAGAVAANTQIALIWENYDLGQRSGSAQYALTVTLQRERSAGGRIAAQIVGAIGSAVGVDRSNSDRVTMQINRSLPYSPILVENLTLALGPTPPGTYRLTIDIQDKVTGRASSRSTHLTIK